VGTRSGCPSFVSEPPGDGMQRVLGALANTRSAMPSTLRLGSRAAA